MYHCETKTWPVGRRTKATAGQRAASRKATKNASATPRGSSKSSKAFWESRRMVAIPTVRARFQIRPPKVAIQPFRNSKRPKEASNQRFRPIKAFDAQP